MLWLYLALLLRFFPAPSEKNTVSWGGHWVNQHISQVGLTLLAQPCALQELCGSGCLALQGLEPFQQVGQAGLMPGQEGPESRAEVGSQPGVPPGAGVQEKRRLKLGLLCSPVNLKATKWRATIAWRKGPEIASTSCLSPYPHPGQEPGLPRWRRRGAIWSPVVPQLAGSLSRKETVLPLPPRWDGSTVAAPGQEP